MFADGSHTAFYRPPIPPLVHSCAFFFYCQQVWGKSGKKGVYPLLFVDDEFLADVCLTTNTLIPLLFVSPSVCVVCCLHQFDEMRDLNEEGELKAKIN